MKKIILPGTLRLSVFHYLRDFFLIVGLFLFTSLHGQMLNLDFESLSPSGKPRGWAFKGRGGWESETNAFHHGHRSVKIEADKDEAGENILDARIPLKEKSARNVRLAGFIKTEKLADGYAGLWCKVYKGADILFQEMMEKTGVSGSSDWTEKSIEFSLPAEATAIRFGVLMTGTGT